MDEAAGGPPIPLSVHGFQGDVAEVNGDFTGLPEARRVFPEQGQDALSAPSVRRCRRSSSCGSNSPNASISSAFVPSGTPHPATHQPTKTDELLIGKALVGAVPRFRFGNTKPHNFSAASLMAGKAISRSVTGMEKELTKTWNS
ncbi:hypothetical protein [Streptomyces pseudovenezuelae]|uniref:Uncharacterized protein n=1 Tax=Streptomyces pseudovenezuelae TaxID=67350 RepID=A0ABT6M1V2_9ACTN|nr:hypothetical protein [Streptomyces pseudovenezuelae]MDH6222534.1 hypothetical protein [Streptomyces pseudovenezuelae]